MINKKDILTRIRAADDTPPIGAYATEIPDNSYVVGNQTSQMVYNQTPEKDMGTGNRDGFAGELNKMASNTYLEKIASQEFDRVNAYKKNHSKEVNRSFSNGALGGSLIGGLTSRSTSLKGRSKGALMGMGVGAIVGKVFNKDKDASTAAFKTIGQEASHNIKMGRGHVLEKIASMAAIKSWPARLVKDIKDAPPLNQLGLAGGAVFGLGKAKGGYDSHKSSKHHANLEERSLKALHKINKNLGQALPVTSKV